MTEKLNGREIAIKNLDSFNAWICERDAANDWSDYIRAGKLNRSDIAAECGFSLSVVRQNPSVKAALAALEERLRAAGTLVDERVAQDTCDPASVDATSNAVDRRLVAAKGRAEQRVKALEEQNAALRAEVHELRAQLNKYRHLDEHLCKTGRLLPL